MPNTTPDPRLAARLMRVGACQRFNRLMTTCVERGRVDLVALCARTVGVLEETVNRRLEEELPEGIELEAAFEGRDHQHVVGR